MAKYQTIYSLLSYPYLELSLFCLMSILPIFQEQEPPSELAVLDVWSLDNPIFVSAYKMLS